MLAEEVQVPGVLQPGDRPRLGKLRGTHLTVRAPTALGLGVHFGRNSGRFVRMSTNANVASKAILNQTHTSAHASQH